MSRTACSGSAVESTIIAFSPPVSASSMASGAAVSASWRSISLATSVEPVKQTPAMRGSAVSGAADRRAVARQKLDHVLRHAGFAQQRHGARGDQRRLFGGLGDDRIAGDECGRDLAGEDRQREIPRRDADDRAARLGAGFGVGGFGRVVAQEIDRLAHFRDPVGQRFAGLARAEREELDGIGFIEVGGAAQDGGALRNRPFRPGGLSFDRDAHGGSSLLGVGFGDRADHIGGFCRIDHRALRAIAGSAGDRRSRPALLAGKGRPGLLDRGQRHRIGDVPTLRVLSARAENRHAAPEWPDWRPAPASRPPRTDRAQFPRARHPRR